MPNAEKVTTDVTVDIGGKDRRLVLDMWALAQMEVASGENAMYGQYFKEMDMNKLITLLWAALLEDPEVEEATKKGGIEGGRKLVAKWIDFRRFDELFAACLKAFEAVAATAKDTEQVEGNAPAAKRSGTGKSN